MLESYDPGWSADVDGRPAAVFAANGFTLAAPVAAGAHAVRFLYRTPGRTTGIEFSLLAAGLVVWLVWLPAPPAPEAPVKTAAQTRRQRRRR